MPQIAAMRPSAPPRARYCGPIPLRRAVVDCGWAGLALPLGLALSDYFIRYEAAVINIDLTGPVMSMRAVAPR